MKDKKCLRVSITCDNNEAQAVDEGAGVCAVLGGGELVPDAGLLQGQTETGKSPLQVHAQGQLVLEQVPHYNLIKEFCMDKNELKLSVY